MRLAGYNAQGQQITGFMGDGGTYTMSVTSRVGEGPQHFWLARSSVAICALTRVSGNFNGGGESLIIRRLINSGDNQPYWVLSAFAQSGTAYGSARCMAYDQR